MTANVLEVSRSKQKEACRFGEYRRLRRRVRTRQLTCWKDNRSHPVTQASATNLQPRQKLRRKSESLTIYYAETFWISTLYGVNLRKFPYIYPI